MSELDKNLLGCIGIPLSIIILMVVGSIMGGWALSTMWGWFIVPIFELPTLTIAQAAGVSCVAGLFRTVKVNQESNDNDFVVTIAKSVGVVVFVNLFAVGWGWVVYQFI